MLISYPILETPQADDTEEAVLARMLARATSPAGQYPANTIGQYKVWHGGLHLEATNATPIRAIADGTIVAYRQASASEQYQGQPYDTSFVLIKHETESGENTPVVFYSLYMHLACRTGMPEDQVSSLIPLFKQAGAMGPDAKSPPMSTATERGLARVYRKDILGYPGLQYGQTDRRVHFEIFTTDEHLQHFWKANASAADQTASVDFYGDAHFVIPAGKTFVARHPNAVHPHRIPLGGGQFFPLDLGQAGTNSDQLIVSVQLGRGMRTTTTCVKQGDTYVQLGTSVKQVNYEYELFRLASALYADCPSAGFEWLRFGRILSSDTTNTNQNWQLVRYSDGATGYIDLAQTDIVALSDADFPYWRGWEKVEEGQIASPDDAFVDDPRALQLLEDVSDAGKQKLRHLVVKHPSEWDAGDLDARYAKLRQPGEPLETEESWQAFEAHVQKLAFWDKTGELERSVWHLHPLQFVYHFRKCGWLSLREQVQLLPRSSMSDAGGQISWAESKKRFTEGNNNTAGKFPSGIWLALNRMSRKYGIDSSLRKAHFLGQIFKETGALRSTSENGDDNYFRKMYENYTPEDAAYDFDHKHSWLQTLGFLKNRDRATYIAQRPGEVHNKAVGGENVQLGDGPRFRGRGLIHLTWRKGYRQYQEYRHRDFTTDPNPGLLQSDSEIAADSAGYFWVKTQINRKADHGSSNQDVQSCFGSVGGAGGLPARQQFFRYAYFILNDMPTMPVESGLRRQVEDLQ
ncbi:M23 family metallopeptidase [Ralstonia sp. ASV6]|uniref:M23 family metallopeptidase n=1 Tax=Ralstonia sp. ASV6 TaxID=2795124 RepID=UPI001E3AD7C4|nr:M23 family metallopeptidase [Ralstonia sp. ASV6]